jgi:hypothetical protein
LGTNDVERTGDHVLIQDADKVAVEVELVKTQLFL